MSGEHENQISQWTNDTVLAYIERVIADQEVRERDAHDEIRLMMDERDRRYAERLDQTLQTSNDRRSALMELSEERDRRYEQRFVAQEKAVQDALASAEKAVAKAETATEKRFEGVNEFREQLADQAREFIPRKETEALVSTMQDRLNSLETKSYVEAGRTLGSSATIAFIISAVVIVATIIGAIIALTG